jgi:hypothetical protein
MLIWLNKKRNGQSATEYVYFLLIISIVFFLFQKYLVRGVSGRLKSVGDSFGSGRIYDPNKTTECAFDFQYTNTWYDAKKFFGEGGCGVRDCLAQTASPSACGSCIQDCAEPRCDPEAQ